MHQQKVVIITGASSGFGRLTALEAARRGYRIVITARRAVLLQEVVDEVEKTNGVVLAIPGDIRDAAHQQRLIDATIERFGRLDILVNNAGLPLSKHFADSSLEELQRQWETNTTSLILLTKRALPALAESHGTVINISSSISRFSVPGWGLYAASKVAVSSVSDALRRELASLGIAVCTVEPGPYDTEFSVRAGGSATQAFGFKPQPVANAIVGLFEHPKRLTVMPRILRPLLAVSGGLMRLLPDVIDQFFFIPARIRARRQRTSITQDSAPSPLN